MHERFARGANRRPSESRRDLRCRKAFCDPHVALRFPAAKRDRQHRKRRTGVSTARRAGRRRAARLHFVHSQRICFREGNARECRLHVREKSRHPGQYAGIFVLDIRDLHRRVRPESDVLPHEVPLPGNCGTLRGRHAMRRAEYPKCHRRRLLQKPVKGSAVLLLPRRKALLLRGYCACRGNHSA